MQLLATHQYLRVGDEQHTMDRLRAFSERYGGRKIWLTEFAVRNTHNEDDVIGVIENLLPMYVNFFQNFCKNKSILFTHLSRIKFYIFA